MSARTDALSPRSGRAGFGPGAVPLGGRSAGVPGAGRPGAQRCVLADVFARYDSTQALIHDDVHLDVGDLVRSGASRAGIERAQRDRVRDEIRRYQQVLRRLGGDRTAQASDPELTRGVVA